MQPAVGVLKSQHSQNALSLSWRTGEKGPVWSGSHTCSHLQSWRVPVAAVLHIWRLHSLNLLFYSKLHCTHSHDNSRLKNKQPVAAEEQWTDWRGKAHSWTERDWERKWLDRHSDSGKFLGIPSIVMKTNRILQSYTFLINARLEVFSSIIFQIFSSASYATNIFKAYMHKSIY